MAGHRVRGFRAAAAIVGLVAALAVGCGRDTPQGPGQPSPVPPPAVGAPAIAAIESPASRFEVAQDLTLTAVVVPGEGGGALTYEWKASAGTITGQGATATLRIDEGVVSTPVDVVVTLTVVKPYEALENGQIVQREYRVSRDAAPIRLHDSEAEAAQIAVRFLTELFADSNLPADKALVDFWPACRGTEEERRDIEDNRRTRLITGVEARVERVSFNQDFTAGEVRAACTFRDIERATGQPTAVTGTCRLDVIYQEARWWLCSSTFHDARPVPTGATTGASGLRPVSGYWRARGR